MSGYLSTEHEQFLERKISELQERIAKLEGARTEVVTLLETLPAEPTPEMIAAVSTILQPYAAKLVWQRMVLAARSPRGALLDGDLTEQRKIHDQSLPQGDADK